MAVNTPVLTLAHCENSLARGPVGLPFLGQAITLARQHNPPVLLLFLSADFLLMEEDFFEAGLGLVVVQ